ncbi:urease accessory protein UreD [Pseudobacillus wudalianchiensis]|uniref:Urease accessory protein UreD n=1 Tax=Pseudobacillus wudalianchiensis TaxID=1743143 RepID=A0A1B9AEA6_9BACI|nr:urease accessory protein UreD [Bacillus wudalianchiensis]OCA82151.1 hypothetical protein A8F95_15780 [Bacillus wudalianchiensis]
MTVTGEWRGTVSKMKGRNVLAHLKRHFPLTEVEFEGENGELIIYLMSGSPGLFNGDRQRVCCRITDEAHLFLTNPSATELHPSLIEEAIHQTETFQLGENSILEYLPEPLIPFKGANFKGKTSLYMEEGSQAIVSEIITPGRVGRGERFEYKRFASQFEVFWQGELQVWDSFQLEPRMDREGPELFNRYTHIGTLWILSETLSAGDLEYIQHKVIPKLPQLDCYGGASLLPKNGMIIRLLGHSSQELQEAIKICWDYFRQQLFHMQPLEVIK